jgi:hypothetical protein
LPQEANPTMLSLDHRLIYQAQTFLTAENAHSVNTWLFCYENSEPNSSRRERYERLLREFVTTKNLNLGIRLQAALRRDRGIELRKRSSAIDEEIGHFL